MKTAGFKANQVTIARVTIDRTKPDEPLTLLAGFTNSETGATHGWVDHRGMSCSKETKQAMDVFLSLLEKDLASAHFSEAHEATNGHDNTTGAAPYGSGGIREFLTAKDENGIPSV